MLNRNLQEYLDGLRSGDLKTLARCLTLVENGTEDGLEILQQLEIPKDVQLIGITGPPGAGKSSLIAALIGRVIEQKKRVAVIAVDPSSPFSHGSLMGDRVRMSEHFLSDQVFIRSMASRGSLGGLAPRILEACDIVRSAGFDYVIIETVGVGQSEVEIAGIADTTVVVLVPEAGDEIQTIKSGVMEIADIFVVNKSDRDGAATFRKNLLGLAHAHASSDWEAPVVMTNAVKKEGVEELWEAILSHSRIPGDSSKRLTLIAERVMTILKDRRTRDIDFLNLRERLKLAIGEKGFNLYRFVKELDS